MKLAFLYLGCRITFCGKEIDERRVGAEGMMPEICLSWNNISKYSMQRVISGCGGQFINFPQNVPATSVSGVYAAASGNTFLLAGKRKVCSACKAELNQLKSQRFRQRNGIRKKYKVRPRHCFCYCAALENFLSLKKQNL